MGASFSCFSPPMQPPRDQITDISPTHAIHDQNSIEHSCSSVSQHLNRPPQQLARDSHPNSSRSHQLQESSSQIGSGTRSMLAEPTMEEPSEPPPWKQMSEQKTFSRRSSQNGPRKSRMPRSSPSLRPGENLTIAASLSRRMTESNAVGLDRVIGSLQGIDRMVAQHGMMRSSSQRLSALMKKSCGEPTLDFERPSLVPVNSWIAEAVAKE